MGFNGFNGLQALIVGIGGYTPLQSSPVVSSLRTSCRSVYMRFSPLSLREKRLGIHARKMHLLVALWQINS